MEQKQKNTLGVVSLIMCLVTAVLYVLTFIGFSSEFIVWIVLIMTLVEFVLSIIACTKKNAKKTAAIIALIFSIILVIVGIVLLAMAVYLALNMIEGMAPFLLYQ